MLRNPLIMVEIVIKNEKRSISTQLVKLSAKQNGLSAKRQGKIMQKLFGERVAGSKKRWFPDDASASSQGHVFKSSQFGKSLTRGEGGKNTLRRITVLNKLFMKHITDMLATGEVSEKILGRGLQITSVKISPDFALVNVFWLGLADPMENVELEKELQRCSGILRHELSQLRVMGEVPRINFVRDKKYENLIHVSNLIGKLDIGEEENLGAEHRIKEANNVQRELFGGKAETIGNICNESDDDLPAMRHDVLGLDHQSIMNKILLKMKKSKEAWELHELSAQECIPTSESSNLNEIKVKVENEESKEFNKFLSQYRSRKDTPERKKYNKNDDIYYYNEEEMTEDVPGLRKPLHDERDYIHEDDRR